MFNSKYIFFYIVFFFIKGVLWGFFLYYLIYNSNDENQNREYLENRIGLLEHYLEVLCYNLGYGAFHYDKESLFLTSAQCNEKFINSTLSNNLTMNNIYEVVYDARNNRMP